MNLQSAEKTTDAATVVPLPDSTQMSDDERWAAVAGRDRSADGRFVFGVITTGVYCRPGCAARLPRRANVRFHESCEAAERAGFRPCRRCRPNEPSLGERHAAKVAAACRLIEAAEEPPDLDALARGAGMSRFHFHRVFKSVTGLTPKAYTDTHRAGRVRDALRESDTVTDAMYDAGFNSSGRFYAATGDMLGMTPTSFRRGAPTETIRFAFGESSLGMVLVAATAKGVCAILLGDEPDALARELQAHFPQAALVAGDAEFEALVARVTSLVDAPESGNGGDRLPLDIRGTSFQRRVWEALRDIPAGATASYGEIAKRIGAADSARAVARACASNRLAVAIPCHRVVRGDGALSGYRWGVERKRALLERERAAKQS